MSSAEHYIATFRGESPETIREAIEAVSSVEPAGPEHRRKLLDICAGLAQLLLESDSQGSLF